MLKVENRESAHLKSRVKDLSVVPNLVSYTALLAAITPIAKLPTNADNLYDPVLIRDTDSLIANFGDPRIDPEKYIDLYTVMQMVGNGATVYLAKVKSGQTGTYKFNPAAKADSSVSISSTEESNVYTASVNKKYNILQIQETLSGGATKDYSINDFDVTYEPDVDDTSLKLKVTFKEAPTAGSTIAIALATSEDEAKLGMIAYSSMVDDIDIRFAVVQAKPLSLKAFYLCAEVLLNGSVLGSAKIKLEPTTTNQSIVNVLNANLGVYARFELEDQSTAAACEVKEEGINSIAKRILDDAVPYKTLTSDEDKKDYYKRHNIAVPSTIPDSIVAVLDPRKSFTSADKLDDYTEENGIPKSAVGWYGKDFNGIVTVENPEFNVTVDDYVNALNQYKARKYVGCLMADLVAPMHSYNGEEPICLPGQTHSETNPNANFGMPSQEERRTLHFNLHEIAVERKDVNLIFSTPYQEDNSNGTPLTVDDACDWTASQNKFNDLWEYGMTNTTDYASQSFYMEMYYSWVNMQCTWLDNGKAKSKMVKTAPSGLVVNNILTSYRERGIHYPVAGDQYGVLPSNCFIINNPKTKAERDQLVQYRINPIYDTGTRGVQIFGNETLNAGYTDLNAAHIARALVYIRSTIDEYTEKLKFSINSLILWDMWKNYVTNFILEPLKSVGCLSSYSVAMGTDTTSPEEMANRMIRGNVSVTFYQSAEIFDLSYTVYSSATTVEAAQAAGY